MYVVKITQNGYPVPGGKAGPPSPSDYKYGTWPSRLGVESRVDNPPRKKLSNRKSEMWPRKCLMKRMQPMQGTGRSSQGIEENGGNTLWKRRPALTLVPMKKIICMGSYLIEK